jgi:F420-dependent oxidoreductase-like protein
MRFGAFIPQGWRLDLVGIEPQEQWTVMASTARAMEAAGYDSIWVYDHFHTVPIPTQEATHEAWTLMAALAAVTSEVRLGQMCTCNGYRSPAYLAKVAATVDVISGGRVEMGIGAGWYEHEYLGYGYPFPKPAARIRQLAEAVQIMDRMWTEDEVSFAGTHYHLQGAICAPKPLQDPRIPLWIAGGGEQLTLRVAARYGDATNFAADLDGFVHKNSVLESHCADIGRDPSEIMRSTNFMTIVAETNAEVEAILQRRVGLLSGFLPPDEAEERVDRLYRQPGSLVGTPTEIVEILRPWQRAGLGYAICYFPDAAFDGAGYELFAAEVIPALR